MEYRGDTRTKCVSLLNSTISTPRSRFGSMDVKNFYYGSPMLEYEYMRIAYNEIPQEIIDA